MNVSYGPRANAAICAAPTYGRGTVVTATTNLCLRTAMLAACSSLPFSQGNAQSIYQPLVGPKLLFENNGIPDSPDLTHSVSTGSWRVAQWAKTEPLDARDFRRHEEARRDPILGAPELSVWTSDQQSALAVYRYHDSYIYELRAKDGIMQSGGSSNLFLTASPVVANATFNTALHYDLDAKLSDAAASYRTHEAQRRGLVLAHVFSGFTLRLRDVPGSPAYNVFLQIAHSGSRHERGGIFNCSIGDGGRFLTIGYGGVLPGAPWLEFTPDQRPPHHLHYELADYLCDLLTYTPQCMTKEGKRVEVPFPDRARELGNWTLGGIYVGIETHNMDKRRDAVDQSAQGSVSVALQLANLSVTRDPEKRAACQYRGPLALPRSARAGYGSRAWCGPGA
jgi:hypothetical protein